MLCISTSEQDSARRWLVQINFLTLKTTFCILLSHKMYKLMQKITKKIQVLRGVYQRLGVNSLTPLIFCLFCSISGGKSCFSVRKSISISERHAKHLFAGRKTQQSLSAVLFSFVNLVPLLRTFSKVNRH